MIGIFLMTMNGSINVVITHGWTMTMSMKMIGIVDVLNHRRIFSILTTSINSINITINSAA